MDILRQPFNREEYSFTFEHKGYSNIEKRFIHYPTGETKLNIWNTLIALGVVGLSVGLSLIAAPLMLTSTLLLVLWIAVPKSRLITQKYIGRLHQNGISYTGPDLVGPAITWRKASNPIYKEAIADWLDEVRQANDIKINRQSWSKYFARLDKIVDEQDKMMLPSGPDFDKLKVLEELMKEGE